MAGNSTISIGFKIEESEGGLKKLILSGKDLQKVMKANVVESEALKTNFINFASIATSLDQVNSTIGSLMSVTKELTSAYAVQEEAEKKLEQVMRNTMGARDEDIKSIKEFCSAQQEIGVIGDEVQLAGAQELATYLELKSSLKSMIPVMNDMLAQQYGLNASGENAAQIATMLGKVLQGQTGALSRYGYKFDEAQEKILKYGTESERVATLVEVVSASVGGMNRQLAQTDSGRMKQLENTIGDIKEQLGAVAMKVQPILTIGANATMATSGVVKLFQAVKALNITLNATKLAMGAVGAALAVVAYAIGHFSVETIKAAKEMDEFSTAQGRAARAAKDLKDVVEAEEDALKGAKSSLEINIAKTKDFNGTKEEEKKLVKELNATYGDTMGYFKTVAEWYQALISNSKAYCDQIVAEAKARKLADKIAEKEIERHNIWFNEDGSQKQYSAEPKMDFMASMGSMSVGQGLVYKKSEQEQAWDKYNTLTQEIDALKKQMSTTSATKIEMPVMGSATPPTFNESKSGKKTAVKEQLEAEAGSIKDLQKQVQALNDELNNTNVSDERLKQILEEKTALEEQIKVLQERAGLIKPEKTPEVKVKPELQEGSLAKIEKELSEKEAQLKLSVVGSEEYYQLAKSIAELTGQKHKIELQIEKDTVDDASKALQAFQKRKKDIDETTGAINQMGSAFSSLGSAIEGTGGEWMSFVGSTIQAMTQLIAQIITMITAKEAEAMAGAASSGAGIGFPQNIGAIAAGVAAVASIFASLPKFADGGIISGPTIGLMGEYAGASGNPEVVAPLDRLQELIGEPAGIPVAVSGEFRIRNSDLVCAISNYTMVASRSGKRSNIKI